MKISMKGLEDQVKEISQKVEENDQKMGIEKTQRMQMVNNENVG